MFNKILIANRGEIAIRVIRSCRELGILTVAVYSDFDRNARYVRLADEAVHIGPNAPAESYLNADRIVGAALETGAEAVHPGYGFLSEQADFARAVASAGMTLVGPPPEAMELMGEKVTARKTALATGFPVVPGTADPLRDADEIVAFGNEYGWPVAIKAAYGGGGRGLKVVHTPEDAPEALEAARREGESYFGSGLCYLERYLDKAHHVEVQVLADTYGNAVAIGERDCSAQRRHQKLIEESPAIVVDDDIRARMFEDAVRLSTSVGYVSAGTVECLVQEDEFYFLEMNTRLQVEHCVTEQVYGIDLVAAQIRIAAGEPLWFGQEDIVPRGHAIECRVNAEDALQGFLPSPGRISRYVEPGGPGVRIDSGFCAGDEISQFYDNLVAKLIVWGEDREQARRRALRALGEFDIGGVVTNIPAHASIIGHQDFISGDVTTRWVEDVWEPPEPEAESPPVGEEEDATEPLVERTATVEVGERRFDVKMWVPESHVLRPEVGGPSRARKRERRSGATSTAVGLGGAVTAPMQGTVLKVLVTEGQTVSAGDPLLVVEAMKMENNICATADGTVTEIKVAAGDSVGAGDVILIVD